MRRQIDLHKWEGDKPKDEVLAIAGAGIIDAAEYIVDRVLPVFEEWLDTHALTDPEMWGAARFSDYGDWGTNTKVLLSEYRRYKETDPRWMAEAKRRYYGHHEPGEPHWLHRAMHEDLAHNLDKLPTLKRFLTSMADDDYTWFGHTKWPTYLPFSYRVHMFST